MIKYAKKTNHVAKKVGAGHYLYRGYTIRKFDFRSLGDPDGWVEWNIYAPGEENWDNAEPTLSMAKRIVDTCIKQAEQRAVNA